MPKRCCYAGVGASRTCNSDERYPDRLQGGSVVFFPFPKPKTQPERCRAWITQCGRPHAQLNPSKITQNYYVCSQHFVHGQPTPDHPNPVAAALPSIPDCDQRRSHLGGCRKPPSQRNSSVGKPAAAEGPLATQPLKDCSCCGLYLQKPPSDRKSSVVKPAAAEGPLATQPLKDSSCCGLYRPILPRPESSVQVQMIRPGSSLQVQMMNTPDSDSRTISIKQEEPEDHPEELDIMQVVVCKEEVSPEQERSPGLLQEEPEPSHIKEEQEEILKTPEEEPDGSMLALPAVKSEEDEDEEDISSNYCEIEVELGPETEDSDEWEEETSGGARSQSSQSHFSCSECPYSFTSQLFLHSHMKKRHSDVYCQMQRNGQILSAARQQNTSSVTGQTQEDTDQPRSDGHHHFTETVTDPGGVNTHKTHICKLCGKSFSYSRGLREHERLHTGEQPFHCKQCGKSFKQRSSLFTHQNVHSGEKPFRCKVCDRRFTQKGNLNKHQRTHTGEKPFHCTECGKGFNEKGNLISHQRLHSGEKPFHCKHCDSRFGWLHHLDRHLRIVHTGGETSPLIIVTRV